MYRFTVATGTRYRQTVQAARPDLAVVKAFKKVAPPACGVLTHVRGTSKAVRAKFHGVDFFCDTSHFLKRAGYTVEEVPHA